ncbi:hypothetical protein ENKNEFLB_02091 [Nocardioides aquaticus]|uniref:Replication protein n=1 Tax=Nocardioides aquaticus TaxID=160826 RepID=A0ABX8EGQ4_9ACTN|nr:hypothetical protein [Nocardioides aquaticus]QVT79701.1 hypothetical protein ENKNEFLB_02091 [Nocardioides aquaticus]
MSTSKTISKSQGWVPLQTAMLNDDDLLLCSVATRLLAVVVLLYAADQGTGGLVPTNPRKVQLHARFGSVDEVQAAMGELVDMDYLVPTTDPGYFLIRSWARYQTDLTGQQAAALVRWHHHTTKGHFEKTVGCSACDAGVPFVDERDQQAQEGVQEPQNAPQGSAAPVEGSSAPATEAPTAGATPRPSSQHAAGAAKFGTRQLVTEFREEFPAVFASTTRLEGYRALLSEAEALAKEHADLSPKVRGELFNAVLGDALEHYLGDKLTGKDYAACYAGAKALNERDGYYWFILAAQSSATVDFTGKPVAYIKTIASNKRAEWAGGTA